MWFAFSTAEGVAIPYLPKAGTLEKSESLKKLTTWLHYFCSEEALRKRSSTPLFCCGIDEMAGDGNSWRALPSREVLNLWSKQTVSYINFSMKFSDQKSSQGHWTWLETPEKNSWEKPEVIISGISLAFFVCYSLSIVDFRWIDSWSKTDGCRVDSSCWSWCIFSVHLSPCSRFFSHNILVLEVCLGGMLADYLCLSGWHREGKAF